MAGEKEADTEMGLVLTALQRQIADLRRELAELQDTERTSGAGVRLDRLERAIVAAADVLQAIYPNALTNDQSAAVREVCTLANEVRKEGVKHADQ